MRQGVFFGGSADVFEWLDRFINLERGQSSKSFRLDRMRLLCEAAGHPELCAPSVHVAGSKGKGSVTTMVASILDEAGLCPGLYVSPHVVDYRERVGLARGPFPESLYAEAGTETEEALLKALGPGNGLLPGEEEPTFFELMTLLYFICCRRASCGAMAVETGMGGRLDATNVVVPEASVITPIELEHTEFLGGTLAAIAGEKAGILKSGRPAVVAAQEREALDVFRAVAAERDVPLRYVPEEAELRNVRIDREGTSATIEFADSSLFARPLDLRLALVGEVQARNAAAAALAVRLAFPAVGDETIRAGLARATLPARFELVRRDPCLVVDGAHTARSVALAAASFVELYGSGGVLVFGSVLGKDERGMAEALAPRFARVIVSTPGTFKRSDPAATAAVFAEVHPRVDLVPDMEKALDEAFAQARRDGTAVLATGSFYLAALARDKGRIR